MLVGLLPQGIDCSVGLQLLLRVTNPSLLMVEGIKTISEMILCIKGYNGRWQTNTIIYKLNTDQ